MYAPDRGQDRCWIRRAIDLAAPCPPARAYSVGVVFPRGGQLSARFLSGGLGVPGTSDVARIRPAILSGCAVRLFAEVIHNGENPGTGPGPLGALERGEAPLGDTPGWEVLAGCRLPTRVKLHAQLRRSSTAITPSRLYARMLTPASGFRGWDDLVAIGRARQEGWTRHPLRPRAARLPPGLATRAVRSDPGCHRS